jgi:hypothetical protein
MSDSFIRPGGLPVPAYVPVATDGSITGDGSYFNPLSVAGTGPNNPTPAFDPTTTVIYVTSNGSDESGNGESIGTAYRTFQRAIRNVPNILDPGARYIIDVTGIGVESFPPDYVFPVIQATKNTFYADESGIPFFRFNNGVTVRAIPQLTTLLTPANATITNADAATISQDPVSNLITLTIAGIRNSWSDNALAGKQIIRTSGSSDAGCVIYGSTPTTLLLCNNADAFNSVSGTGDSLTFGAGIVTLTDASAPFLPNMNGHSITIADASNPGNNGTFTPVTYISPTQISFPNGAGVNEPAFTGEWTVGGVGALVLANGDQLNIVEPSATFLGATPNNEFATISSWNVSGICFQGIHFTSPGNYALTVANAMDVIFEFCVIDGFYAQNISQDLAFFATNITISYDTEPAATVTQRSLFSNFNDPLSYIFPVGIPGQIFRDTVFDVTFPTLSNGITSGGVPGPLTVVVNPTWALYNCLFQGPRLQQGDAIDANGSYWMLTNVEINGAQGNAFSAGAAAVVSLLNVGGSGSTGVGIFGDNGAVIAVDGATAVTGSNPGVNDVQSGSLAPVSYATLRAPNVQYDLPPLQPSLNFATGTRIYNQ